MIKPAQKEKIINRIKELEDINLIDDINRLLEIEFDDSTYKTNENQKNAIREARNQIKKGDTLTENQADNEIDEWLEK